MSDYSEIEEHVRHMKQTAAQDEGKEIARRIADYLNGHNAHYIVMGMAEQHRTLQQSFTRVCIEWLEHCASLAAKGPGYYDARNQASVEIAKKLSQTEVWPEVKYLPYI